MKRKYLILFICSVIFLTILTVTIAIFSNTNKNDLKEKNEQEISYIEMKLIGMINALNNVSFSNSVLLEQNTVKGQSNENKQEGQQNNSQDQNNSGQGQNSQNEQQSSENNSSEDNTSTEYTKYNIENKNILIQDNQQIDWDYIKNTVEILYSTWPTVMIDLHSSNVKNEDVLNFSRTLDELVVNIEKEDKRATLINLATLYGFLPVYLEQFSDDSDKINIAYTKSCVINSYMLIEDDNWAEMQAQIAKASEYFSNVINSVKEDRQKSSISKTYIAINEMNNIINLKDRKLFYLKYINLMESAMSI